MPFLGNTPTNTFVSIAKQTITGNGGTTYTLSYPVTNANEIDVFFNNVRQEPTVAYTASGTTIVFSEAIASTDAVYVIFNGQAVGTIDAPAGAYLPTTGGTVSGQVTVNNRVIIQQDSVGNGNNRLTFRGQPGSSYRWNIDNNASSNTLRVFRENDSDGSSGVVHLSIDANGRVIKPNQVGFSAYYSGSTYNSSPIYDMVAFNTGNAYNSSTGTFTAPVAGVYQLSGWYRFNQTGTTYCQFGLKRNGSSNNWGSGGAYINSTLANTTYATPIVSVAYYLNAGDYVTTYAVASGGSPSVSGYESWFSCYLLG